MSEIRFNDTYMELTNDVQVKLIRFDRYGGNLTFVDSLVTLLCPLYAEGPVGPFVAMARILSV